MSKRIVIAITGASGSIYAKRLIEKLEHVDNPPQLAIIMSSVAREVWKTELDSKPVFNHKQYEPDDFMAPFASGSSVWDSMIVVPCTMGSLGKIANGIADNLITRAADVFLKERKQLILVPRETPFNHIHLENMRQLNLAGALIMPASPSFYSRPQSIDELADSLVHRMMDHLGYPPPSAYRW
ncbi:MAG TPA: UbiX family flavin prenyltransferase [Bacteroidales bacterium]|nr:UbiX family flavin prenyltransferase [Bacteroidales bacterium]